MKPVIYLDMDGVCCNFVKGACEAHHRDYDEVMENWPKGTYDICEVLSIDPVEFWGVIGAEGADFWWKLEEYPWFHFMYVRLDQISENYGAEQIQFATMPTEDPECAAGKIMWLQDQFGEDFRDFILIPNKRLLARPGAILIDDSEANNKDFLAGGNFYGQGPGAVLVPQVFNSGIPVEPKLMAEYIVELAELWLKQFTAEVV